VLLPANFHTCSSLTAAHVLAELALATSLAGKCVSFHPRFLYSKMLVDVCPEHFTTILCCNCDHQSDFSGFQDWSIQISRFIMNAFDLLVAAYT
jgi:hypothetical protein